MSFSSVPCSKTNSTTSSKRSLTISVPSVDMASDEAPPDTPRQPLSPYFHFAAEARKGITEPNLTPDGVNHKLQEMWNSLDTDARQVYERKAKEDQQRYKQEMSKYRNAYGW